MGDEQILRYTRWYSQAAVMLTKSDVTGRVITMGYHELNQRDSFWTSFVHLSFWPKLEQAMLRESCLWQKGGRKLPTTILPKYERETDVDINEYFCLRIARYFHWHRDLPFLRECWPHFCRSVEFLLTLDRDGDGLPEQAPPENPLCFWADWKDVKGIVGRKLAPHFVLLWLAVLQEGILLSQALESEKSEAWFRELFQRAKAQTELPVQEGGLWQGDHYTELWYDGRKFLPCSRIRPWAWPLAWWRKSGQVPFGRPSPGRTRAEFRKPIPSGKRWSMNPASTTTAASGPTSPSATAWADTVWAPGRMRRG